MNWRAFSIIFGLGMGLAVFAGAQTGPGTQPNPTIGQTQPPVKVKPKIFSATSDPSYLINPDDTLEVSVWKEPELSGAVPVRPDGKISIPLVDDVQAAGLTAMELSAQVTEKLKKFVADPHVTIIVTAINNRRVYVLGEVGRPGGFALLPDMTVLQAISDSGGLTQFAHGKKIYVLRSEAGKQVKYPFDYNKVLKGQNAEQNIVLKPGDTIVVP
jgi:polysaccharide biosynthesis/export protein